MKKVQLNKIKSNFRKDVSDLVSDLFEALEASDLSKSHSKPSKARKITSKRRAKTTSKLRSKPTTKITKQRSSSGIQKVTPINKIAIVKLLKKNTLPDVILQKFPMYTKGQISAISAHVTMGTY
jgi:hypothetical protein